jgi:uncharacterized protein
MEVIISFAIIITFLGTVYPMRDIPKNNMGLYSSMTGVEQIALNYQVKPFMEIKDKHVMKQEFDYSCGSAALATLLDGYLGEKLTEQQVIQGMMQYGDADKIQERRAFSLLDMKRFVEVLGYKGSGYKAEFNDLKTLDKPAIVPIEFFGYKHFVVFRGIYGDHLFVADPNVGNTSYTIDKFKEMWNPSIIFVVSDEEIQTNALKLTSDDLRVIEYNMSKSAYTKALPEEFVKEQRQFKESLGGVLIRSVKH